MKNAENAVKNSFPVSVLPGVPVEKSDQELQLLATNRFYDLVYKENIDPKIAYSKVLSEFKDKPSDLPDIPGIPSSFSQNTDEGIQQAASWVNQQVLDKKISRKKGSELLKSLVRRKDTLRVFKNSPELRQQGVLDGR